MRVKTAFVTGGSSSIGEAIILRLKDDGWSIIAPTRDVLDLSNLNAIGEYLKNLSSDIDTFIHVAGIWHDDKSALAGIDYGEFSDKQIADTMNVGITSPMIIVSYLIKNNNLHNFIGISGTFNNGAKGWLPYYASKRALEDFIIGLSQDNKGISCFGISPADTATRAYSKFYPADFSSAQSPNVIAETVIGLLSGGLQYESGSIIEVRDGKLNEGFHV